MQQARLRIGRMALLFEISVQRCPTETDDINDVSSQVQAVLPHPLRLCEFHRRYFCDETNLCPSRMFREGGECAEDKFAARGGGHVDLRLRFESDTAGAETFGGLWWAGSDTPQAVEVPHNEGAPFPGWRKGRYVRRVGGCVGGGFGPELVAFLAALRVVVLGSALRSLVGILA